MARVTREQLQAVGLLLSLVIVAALVDIVIVVIDDHIGSQFLKHPIAILIAVTLAVAAVLGLLVGLLLSGR